MLTLVPCRSCAYQSAGESLCLETSEDGFEQGRPLLASWADGYDQPGFEQLHTSQGLPHT